MSTTEINNPFADILKVPELKRRIFFTLAILAAYRVGATIPVPGVNADALRGFFAAQQNTLLGFLNIFSGGAMGRLAIFAMGVGPYINASIIISLLQGAHVIPYLDRLAKEGQQGQKRMNQITRYLTLALGGLQSFGLTLTISKMTAPGGVPIVTDPSAGWIALTVLTLTTGSVFIMWLGEQITERGIGNGVSLIIFSGIVDRLPSAFADLVRLVRIEEFSLFRAIFLFVALMVVITGLVVWVETAQRKIPVQYAKRVVGRRMYGGASTYLPLEGRSVRRDRGDLRGVASGGSHDGGGIFSAFRVGNKSRGFRSSEAAGLMRLFTPDLLSFSVIFTIRCSLIRWIWPTI